MTMMTPKSLLRWLVEPEPPGLGLDLRDGAFSLARIGRRRGVPELDLCLTAPLPPGAIAFRPEEPNIQDREALQIALESVLTRAGVARPGRIALTLPDHLSRIAVIELNEPPRSSAETSEMLKFRLGKAIPFDAARARLAYENVPGSKTAFLTGVMHDAVVSQYEDFLTELGFEVGLVLPASVSLLKVSSAVARKFLAPGSDYFFVNVERDYFTVSLVRDCERPVLVRTLGRRAASGESGEGFDERDLVQEIIPTAIYYREKLAGTTLQRIYYRSLRSDMPNLHELLEEQFEAPSEPFSLTSAIAATPDLRIDKALLDAVGPAAGAAAGKVA